MPFLSTTLQRYSHSQRQQFKTMNEKFTTTSASNNELDEQFTKQVFESEQQRKLTIPFPYHLDHSLQ